MAESITIRDTDDLLAVVPKGSSCDIVGTFDFGDDETKASAIQSITLTLFDETTNNYINSRNGQNVKNANGGTLDADTGEFTMKLAPADNAIVGSTGVREKEKHRARFTFIWLDSSGDTRTGVKEYIFEVENLATPTAP